jgi:hypothetical protein
VSWIFVQGDLNRSQDDEVEFENSIKSRRSRLRVASGSHLTIAQKYCYKIDGIEAPISLELLESRFTWISTDFLVISGCSRVVPMKSVWMNEKG